MKRFLPIVVVLAVSACFAQEQAGAPESSRLDSYLETGMEVSGVRAPYYDDEGKLKVRLFGGHAKILDGGVADVSHLRIDVFEDGEIIMTVYAPQCFSQMVDKNGRKVLSVHSEGEVLIDMGQMTISGKGFRFTSEQNRFEILGDSKVLVKESARGMKGLGL